MHPEQYLYHGGDDRRRHLDLVLLVLIVDAADKAHDWGDAEEVVRIGEEPHPGNDDGLEVVELRLGSVERGEDFQRHRNPVAASSSPAG